MLTGSVILDSVSLATRRRCLDAAVYSRYAAGVDLFQAGAPATQVHFLTDGVASVITRLVDGRASEFAIYGNGSAPGAIGLLGRASSNSSCVMVVSGAAYSMPLSAAQVLFEECADFRSAILSFIQDHNRVGEQFATCTSSHAAEPRLARWLLCCSKLLGSRFVPVTQERLAELLCTRRPTISLAAASLEASGCVRQLRGGMRILDPQALMGKACSCYAVWCSMYLERRKLPAPASPVVHRSGEPSAALVNAKLAWIRLRLSSGSDEQSSGQRGPSSEVAEEQHLLSIFAVNSGGVYARLLCMSIDDERENCSRVLVLHTRIELSRALDLLFPAMDCASILREVDRGEHVQFPVSDATVIRLNSIHNLL